MAQIKNRNIAGVATANIVLLVAEKVASAREASARALHGEIPPFLEFGGTWKYLGC